MYNNRLIWLNGEILKVEDAKVSVLSPTAQFGANVFEGIRCYWNNEQQALYAFRLDDHYNRLLNSMKMFRMELKFTVADFKQALIEIVKANGYKEDIAVRQTVFIDGHGSWFSEGPIGMFVAPIPKGRTLLDGKNGYSACISSWERISDRNISPRIKVGANYINSRMAQLEAKHNGYDTSIFMNSQGKISEGPGSCLFIVRDGKIHTPLLTDSVLESITRDTVIEIAKDLGFVVIERSIERTELYISDEVFLCGSAMEIVPIISIDGFHIKNSDLSITKKLISTYMSCIYGFESKYKNWLTKLEI